MNKVQLCGERCVKVEMFVKVCVITGKILTMKRTKFILQSISVPIMMIMGNIIFNAFLCFKKSYIKLIL